MPGSISQRRGGGGSGELDHLRVSFIRRVEVAHAGRTQHGLALDIGVQGLFIEPIVALRVGHAVRVRFTLPGNHLPIEASCHVAWDSRASSTPGAPRPPGLALQFIELSERERVRLRLFVAAHLERDPRGRQFARPWPPLHDDRGQTG